MLLHEHDEVVL